MSHKDEYGLSDAQMLALIDLGNTLASLAVIGLIVDAAPWGSPPLWRLTDAGKAVLE